MDCRAFATLLLLVAACNACEAARLVAPDRLVEEARAVLQARSAGLPGQLEFVHAANLPASHVDEEGALRFEAGAVDGAWPRKRVGVPVRIWAGERLVQSRMIWFTVRWWREVSVYGHDAQAGADVSSLAMHVARTDLAGTAAAGPLFGAEVPQFASGLRLRRAVRAGQPVLAGDFEPTPAVASRAQVVLAVRQGPVELKTTAIAQGDGELGELIRVLPSGAEQWVQARVVARNEVAIEN